jgi:hypothetical protein
MNTALLQTALQTAVFGFITTALVLNAGASTWKIVVGGSCPIGIASVVDDENNP